MLLLVLVSAAGCSMLGFHRKDAEAPTQVALSLYAAPNVNPNADASPPDMSAPAMQTSDMATVTVDIHAEEGPYLVNLTGGSKAELAEKMKALLDYLQTPDEGRPAPQVALEVSPVPGAAAVDSAPSVSGSHGAGTVASTVQPTVATAAAVAPYAPGVPSGVGKITAGAASILATPPPTASPMAAAPRSWSLAAAPLTRGNATVIEQVPVPLHAGSQTSAAGATHANAPALGQYADSPSGPSSTPEASTIANAGTPISFKILQLKDDSMFLNADHDLLAEDLRKALGSTYIDDDDYVLQPGQFKYIDFKKMDKNTRYIAVLANFHDQSSAAWKQVMRIEAGGYKYSLLVMLQNLDVVMTDESYHQPPRKKS
ncbi:MAG TPA: type VI secretion system lipoprotein TssJ [Dyella sp.]|uniref:type VI secretion system lipoprotein TssJ n=1 Tax=Dyella sp. TaxID=1869338 RepID=UPI002B79C3D4|nr:type VI secretion system lipoprotein TssJ [Dyella sp.]HTV86025.1 type VI secretion system lipoprotein TssJ [Dyella sp.]